MIFKKLILSLLALGILGTSAAHASESSDKIKVGSSLAAGLAAGAAVGKFMPAPLPVKVLAGAATSALVTPWLLLFSCSDAKLTPRPKTWQEEIKNAAIGGIMLGHPIAAPTLAITAGICIGKALPTNLPIKIVAGSTIATGIMAAGTALWGRLLLAIGASSFRG